MILFAHIMHLTCMIWARGSWKETRESRMVREREIQIKALSWGKNERDGVEKGNRLLYRPLKRQTGNFPMGYSGLWRG